MNLHVPSVQACTESATPPSSAIVYIYDSRPGAQAELCEFIRSRGYKCLLLTDLFSLASVLRDPDLVFFHERRGEATVCDLIDAIARNYVLAGVVGFSEEPLARDVVRAIRAGALDYLFHCQLGPDVGREIERVLQEHFSRGRNNLRGSDAVARIGMLSPRERQVLDLLYEGLTNKEMARVLGLSPRTVEVHRTRMLSKLCVRNSTDALKLKFLSLSSAIEA